MSQNNETAAMLVSQTVIATVSKAKKPPKNEAKSIFFVGGEEVATRMKNAVECLTHLFK